LKIQGTEQGIHNLQNQLQTRDVELNKERKIRKQLEQQFEKTTEKRLIKELLPKRVPATSSTRNYSNVPSRNGSAHPDYSKPISVATGEMMNNNRFIYAPTSNKHQAQRVGAYF
jgi:hypothetical protein